MNVFFFIIIRIDRLIDGYVSLHLYFVKVLYECLSAIRKEGAMGGEIFVDTAHIVRINLKRLKNVGFERF